RLLADQRLAQDVGEEAGGGEVGLARADGDGGEANADAVDKALARIVVAQQFANGLLGAVAGERRAEELVADGVGERRAEDGDRGGEDETRQVGAILDALLA